MKTPPVQNSPAPQLSRSMALTEQFFRLLILTAVLVVPIFMRGFGTDRYLIPKAAIVGWVAVVLIGYFLIRGFTGKRMRQGRTIILPFLVFLSIAAVSALRSLNVSLSLEVLLLWFSAFIFYLAVAELMGSSKSSWLCLCVVQAGATVSAVLYILTTFSLVNYAPLVDSTFGNKNFFSEYLVLTLPVLCVMAFKRVNKQGRFVFIAGVLIQAGALILGTSQGAWLGVLFAFIIAGFGVKKIQGDLSALKPVLIAFVVILLLVIIISAVSEQINLWSDIKTSLSPANRNVKMRWLVWKASLGLIAENPVMGIGIGNYDEVFPLFRDPEEWAFTGQTTHANWAHNSFIHFGSEVGLVGFLAFLWLLGTCIKTGWRRLEGPTGLIHWAIAAAIGGMFINSLVGTNFNLPANLLLLGIYMGLLDARKRREVPAEKVRMNDYWLPIAVVLGLMLLFFGILPLKPYLADQLLADGIQEHNRGRTSLALTSVKNSVDVYPFWKESQMHLAIIEQHQGQYDSAIAFYESLAEQFPNDIRIHNNLGLAYEKSNHIQEAVEGYQRAVELNPTSLSTLQALGRVALKNSKYAIASQAYEKALDIGPKDYSTYISAGDAAAGLEQFTQAAEYYEKAIHDQPDNARLWFNLGLYRQQSGQYQEAISAYRQAISRSETLKQAYNNIAKCYISLQKPGGAVEILQKALKQFPDSPDFHFNIAIVYNGLGEKEKAAEHLAMARRLAPERTDFNLMLN